MPIGRLFSGVLHSSAEVATVSNPIKEKNTTAAPAMIPPGPNGRKGSRLSATAWGAVTATKATIAQSVMRISAMLSFALSFVPCARISPSTSVMTTAGRLMRPPSGMVVVSAFGISIPSDAIMPEK